MFPAEVNILECCGFQYAGPIRPAAGDY